MRAVATQDARSGDCRIAVDVPSAELRRRLAAEPSVVVTDANVRRLHGAFVPGASVIEIDPGEPAKEFRTVERMHRGFRDLELDRSTFVWGVGGGVVCDLTGFAASTYLRGYDSGSCRRRFWPRSTPPSAARTASTWTARRTSSASSASPTMRSHELSNSCRRFPRGASSAAWPRSSSTA